jgi:hypothetical protein
MRRRRLSRRCCEWEDDDAESQSHAHYPQTHTAETQRHGTIYKGSTRNVIEDMTASSQCGSLGAAAVAVPEGLARHQRRFAYYRRRHHQLADGKGMGFLSIKAILS